MSAPSAASAPLVFESVSTGWPSRFRRELFEPILHGLAQTLQCNSANLAIIDEDQQSLVIALGCTARGIPNLPSVENALGFSVSGLKVPLSLSRSHIVRALREERLFCTTEIREIAGHALPDEVVQAVEDIIGPRSFAVVPVLGRTSALGVLLVDRVGDGGFTAQERELLLTYAERVGTELESENLQGTAQRLERLGQFTLPPPALLFAAPDAARKALFCVGGSRHGQPLHHVLALAVPDDLLDGGKVLDRLAQGETVTLTLAAEVPSVVADLTLPLPLRVTLRPVPTQPVLPLQIAGTTDAATAASGQTATTAPTAGTVTPTTSPPQTDAQAPASAPLFCVAVEDLTWSHNLRRELALAKQRLAKVMGSIGDAILTLDKTGVVQQANDASQTVLGVPASDLCGSLGLDLAATPRARAQLRAMSEELQQRGFAEVELRLLRRSVRGGPSTSSPTSAATQTGIDRPRRFLARMSALLLCDDNGAPEGAVWRIQDLTDLRRDAAERHRLQLRLVQSERLSALGEMAARIAHEVRNPMVSIGAAAHVVADELPDSSPVRSEALAICSEVRRLDHILNNVLRFARPPRAAAQRTDVVEALRHVLGLLRPRTTGLQVQFDAGSAPGALYAVIDSDQLKQVLWNILLNACDAARATSTGPAAPPSGADRSTEDGAPPPAPRDESPSIGVIECGVRKRRHVHSSAAPKAAGAARGLEAQPGVLITIADSGPGIPAALRRRVFDPFFSTKTRGTGLGLPISKQIIEAAGGRIRLLNRPGGGTRVVIELRAD